MLSHLEKLALRCMNANEINTFCGVMSKRTVGDFGSGFYKIKSQLSDPKKQMRLMKVLEEQKLI
jgi:hypothetical protein